MILIYILIIFFGLYGILLGVFRYLYRKPSKTVVLTGGGTGGHVYPLLAILEEIKLRHPDYSFFYIGKAGKAEDHIIPKEGIRLLHTWAYPFEGKKSPIRLIFCMIVNTLGAIKCFFVLMKLRPCWIISTGSYVSVPTLLAATIIRRLFRAPLKIYLHEQNTVPGKANLTIGKMADIVFVSFPQTLKFFMKNGVFSGYPVRRAIYKKDTEPEPLPFIPKDRKIVFVFGGSQGARTINRALVEALPYLFPYRNKIFIIHGRGLAKSDIYDAEKDTEAMISKLDPEIRDSLPSFYYAQNYFHNIDSIYAISHLIVARSGAGAISEIAAAGKPAILIPKSGLPGDHQVMNAKAMKQTGAAHIIYEDVIKDQKGELIDYVSGQRLSQEILRLLQDSSTLANMSANAKAFFQKNPAKIIVDIIEGKRSPQKAEVVLESIEIPQIWTNGKLLSHLQKEYAKNPRSYNPLNVLKDEDELEYFRYRTTRLLMSRDWELRNIGVKLAGYLLCRDKIPELLRMIEDRTPAPLWQRMLGGDYREVGFIRRNALTAIKVLNHIDSKVEEVLEKALKDPYYEVRAEACRVISHFSHKIAGKEKWFNSMLEKLSDPSFEVVVEATLAIGNIGIDNRALEALLRLGNHYFWQVREAALRGILRLLERHIICPTPELYKGLENFVLTSTDFTPIFTIKEVYQKIILLCEERIRKKECPYIKEIEAFRGSV